LDLKESKELVEKLIKGAGVKVKYNICIDDGSLGQTWGCIDEEDSELIQLVIDKRDSELDVKSIVLHELGHIVTGFDREVRREEDEKKAWMWAIEQDGRVKNSKYYKLYKREK